MFPLKRRRKYARVYRNNLEALVVYKEKDYTVSVKDLSASGCNITLKEKEFSFSCGDYVLVKFSFSGEDFEVRAVNVRENCFNFEFDDVTEQRKLNNLILTEYFKETPELIPVKK